jgi:hypothetical protein
MPVSCHLNKVVVQAIDVAGNNSSAVIQVSVTGTFGRGPIDALRRET